MPTSINWPQGLAGVRLLQDGFSLQPGQKKIEASFSSGRSYSKLPPVKTPDRFSGAFLFDFAQYEIFDNFWRETLLDATKSYNWYHPITDAKIEVKIVGTPVTSGSQANTYLVECNFEIVEE